MLTYACAQEVFPADGWPLWGCGVGACIISLCPVIVQLQGVFALIGWNQTWRHQDLLGHRLRSRKQRNCSTCLTLTCACAQVVYPVHAWLLQGWRWGGMYHVLSLPLCRHRECIEPIHAAFMCVCQ